MSYQVERPWIEGRDELPEAVRYLYNDERGTVVFFNGEDECVAEYSGVQHCRKRFVGPGMSLVSLTGQIVTIDVHRFRHGSVRYECRSEASMTTNARWNVSDDQDRYVTGFKSCPEHTAQYVRKQVLREVELSR